MTLLGLSPLALAALVAAAAAALFGLHLLRVRPEIKQVPTLLFWKEAVEETRARTLFGRFRHPRTYAFLTALAALLALALAEPETTAGREATPHVVLVVDIGAPLTALVTPPDGEAPPVTGERIFDAVLDSADRFLHSLSLRERVAVLTTEPGSGLVVDLDEPRSVARERAAAQKPAATAGDVAGALRRAAALLDGRPRPRVVLLTGPGPLPHLPTRSESGGGQSIAPQGIPLVVARHGRGIRDRGLTGVAFRSTLSVRLAHDGASGPCAIEVRRLAKGVEAERLASLRVEPTGPRGSVWVEVPGVKPTGEMVVLRLVPGDRFPPNDRLVYRLPLRRVRRVEVDPSLPPAAGLLVREHPWLERATPAGGADLRLAAGEEEAAPLAADLRPAVMPGGELLRDGAWGAVLPRLGPGVRALRAPAPGRVLLAAGGKPLLRLLPGDPPTLVTAPRLLDAAGAFCRHPEGAAFLAGLLERVAGNRPGAPAVPADTPLALLGDGAERVTVRNSNARLAVDSNGLFRLGDVAPARLELEAGERETDLAVHPSRVLSAEPEAAADSLPAPPAAPLRGWEWLAMAALALLLVDAWLHVRGRIP